MFKKIFLVSSLLVFSLLFLTGCGQSQSIAPVNKIVPDTIPFATSTSTTTTTTTTTTSVTPITTYQINIQNYSFTPAALTVQKGATVTWTNNDSAPHQIKSDSFNSSTLSNGQTFSFTFNNAGTFDYSCAIHPSMTGQIIVE